MGWSIFPGAGATEVMAALKIQRIYRGMRYRTDLRKHVESKKVSFQWENPDFLLENPDFLLRNPDFLLKMLIL